jgi:hypothetical protein
MTSDDMPPLPIIAVTPPFTIAGVCLFIRALVVGPAGYDAISVSLFYDKRATMVDARITQTKRPLGIRKHLSVCLVPRRIDYAADLDYFSHIKTIYSVGTYRGF